MNTDNLENLDNQEMEDINLDALSAPEGNFVPELTGAGEEDITPESVEHEIQDMGLRNLDAEMDAELGLSQEEEAQNELEEQEEISDLSEMEGSGVLEHPEVNLLKEAIDSGLTIDEYYKQRFAENKDFSELSDREVMYNNYKEKYGWDDEKLNSVLDRQEASGTLDIEAEEIRKMKGGEETDRHTQILQRRKEEYSKHQQQLNEQRENELNSAIEQFDTSIDDVFGLPISKADKEDFKGAFKEMLELDDKGGSKLGQMLQSNENLTKVAYLLYKGDKAIKEALFTEKEKAKESFIKNVDPEVEFNREANYNSGEVDLDALSRPERY